MAGSMIVGNWKMHKTPSQAKEYISVITSLVDKVEAKVVLAVPYVDLGVCREMLTSSKIKIAAQNVSEKSKGPYTGEISADMLKDVGAEYVLLGHSERRIHFHESDAVVREKMLQALSQQITPIICFGESLEDRNSLRQESVVTSQIQSCLADLDIENVKKIVLAYEPVWAIGTGLAATSEQVTKMHRFCRSIIEKLFGSLAAKEIVILYGGSVHEGNIVELTSLSDVDGVLVGGASLDPLIFGKMIQMCANKR